MTDGMVHVPGGRFRMGSDVHYRAEAPAHDAIVSGFWIDVKPVTNCAYAAFADATGYVTVAEKAPDALTFSYHLRPCHAAGPDCG